MFPIVRAPIKDHTLEEMLSFFAVGEGKSQDDEDKEQLHADLCVIGQRPFHGVGVVERVADTDKGDAGDGGGEGRMDKTGCDCGAGSEK